MRLKLLIMVAVAASITMCGSLECHAQQVAGGRERRGILEGKRSADTVLGTERPTYL